MNVQRVQLGCDTGEAAEGAGRQRELALLPFVDTVSIACGGHAGDDDSMRVMMSAAIEHHCGIGAHPSYPDRGGFGRRHIQISRSALEASVSDQLRALSRIAESLGAAIEHVKPHGALYHDLASDPDLAVWLAGVFEQTIPNARIVLPVGSGSIEAIEHSGRLVAREGFCDRVYEPDGTLRDRALPGALIDDDNHAAAQCETLIQDKRCDLLCVHSDTPNALSIARAVRGRLESLLGG